METIPNQMSLAKDFLCQGFLGKLKLVYQWKFRLDALVIIKTCWQANVYIVLGTEVHTYTKGGAW